MSRYVVVGPEDYMTNEKIMRPFHRQAKVRAVAEPLSRAMSSVDLCFSFFMEIDTLDKEPATSSLAACRKKWFGVVIRLAIIKIDR